MTTEDEIEFDRTVNLMKRIYIYLSLVIIGVLFYQQCETKRQTDVIATLNETLKDSLITYKTKNGLNAAKISVFEADKSKDFINLATKDTTIQKLQKLVDLNSSKIKKQGSVVVINTQTTIRSVTPTKVIDTILGSDSIKSPVYASSFNLRGWVKGNVIATKDSTSVTLNYKEELNLVIGRQKTGFLGLGKSKTFADVVLLNPYSEVKQMRVYTTKELAKKRISVGPGVYYGIGQGFIPQVFFGVGVQYSIFNF